mgnify:CR=1 FL=1
MSAGSAAIIVAAITGLFGVLTIWVQAKVHRDNRNDHAETAAKVSTLIGTVGEVKADVSGIKADVSGIKTDVAALKLSDRDHEGRIEAIESPKPRTTRKKSA